MAFLTIRVGVAPEGNVKWRVIANEPGTGLSLMADSSRALVSSGIDTL